jgi:hypothetical protein
MGFAVVMPTWDLCVQMYELREVLHLAVGMNAVKI